MDCIFCKISNKEQTADIVYEDDSILGFKNVSPEAPVHFLFIPRKHIEWGDKMSKENSPIFSRLIDAAEGVAIEKKIHKAHKLIFNVGKTGHISHIHLHLLGGWKRNIPMHNI